jgi:hypothetical protein
MYDSREQLAIRRLDAAPNDIARLWQKAEKRLSEEGCEQVTYSCSKHREKSSGPQMGPLQ